MKEKLQKAMSFVIAFAMVLTMATVSPPKADASFLSAISSIVSAVVSAVSSAVSSYSSSSSSSSSSGGGGSSSSGGNAVQKAVISATRAMLTSFVSSASKDTIAKNATQTIANCNAAWEIANANGDTAKCEELHNKAEQARSTLVWCGYECTYDAESGKTYITDSSGNTSVTNVQKDGKQTTVTYETYGESGSKSYVSASSYDRDTGISTYMSCEGAKAEDVTRAYNNDAGTVNKNATQGSKEVTAQAEAAVVAFANGWTKEQESNYAAALTKNKGDYTDAQTAYLKAKDDLSASEKAGDTAGVEAAKAAMAEAEKGMKAANEANEALRAENGYSGNGGDYDDGGFIIPNLGDDGSGGFGSGGSGSSSSSGSTPSGGTTPTPTPSPSGSTPTVNIGNTTIGSDTGNKDGSIKSGYGVTTKVSLITGGDVFATGVRAEYDWGYGNSGFVDLQYDNGSWVFPVDDTSITQARKLYIPVETKDGTYTIKYIATMIDYEGNIHHDTQYAHVTVKGSMYEDDFTGDRK